MSLQKLCQNNDGDGCGEMFGNKSSIGLCAKCSKLATLNMLRGWWVFSPEFFCLLANFLCRLTLNVYNVAWLGNILRAVFVEGVNLQVSPYPFFHVRGAYLWQFQQ